MTNLIEVRQLSKIYGAVQAVNRVSWSVPEGSITGLVGPNGAGKTTTLKLLMGLAHPTHGSAQIGGYNIVAKSLQLRQVTAFVPEDKILYERMRTGEFLSFYCHYSPEWNQEKAKNLCTRWDLDWKKKIATYSKGMHSRLALAAAMLRNPRVLLLDEPTDGMDPEAIEDTLQQLTLFVAEDVRSILICTHRLDEVERICDRVILMGRGRILAEGELDELRAAHKLIQVVGSIPAAELDSWSELAGWEQQGNVLRIRTHSSPETVLEKLRGHNPAHIDVLDMNLREIYLTRVGGKGGSDAAVENLV